MGKQANGSAVTRCPLVSSSCVCGTGRLSEFGQATAAGANEPPPARTHAPSPPLAANSASPPCPARHLSFAWPAAGGPRNAGHSGHQAHGGEVLEAGGLSCETKRNETKPVSLYSLGSLAGGPRNETKPVFLYSLGSLGSLGSPGRPAARVCPGVYKGFIERPRRVFVLRQHTCCGRGRLYR